MTLLGILLLVVALGLFIVSKFVNLRTEDVTTEGRFGDRRTLKAHPKFLTEWSGKKSVIIGVLGILSILSSSAFFYARPGHQYYIVYPTGKVVCEYEQGWKTCFPFSRIQEWESFTDIKVVKDGENLEGIEGPIAGGIPIRFIDKVVGTVQLSVRMQLPQDDKSFKQIVQEFRHPKNLINNTLIPTVKEQVINTGYMFTAEDYVSGDASNFRATLDEQLKSGGYAVDKIEHFDTITSPIVQEDGRKIVEVQTRYEVNKRIDKKTGLPIRIHHDITKNNIIVSQVIVDQVVLESKFRKKLEDSRDISAQKSIELQKIETAKAAQQRIVAEGERDKAAEKVEQELAQVKKLIAAETSLKEESIKLELAKKATETEEEVSKKIKIRADAEAYKTRKNVAAGISPERRLELELDAKVRMEEARAKRAVPTTMIVGGGDGKNGQSISNETLMLMQLTNKGNQNN
jgi:hypothetical protein